MIRDFSFQIDQAGGHRSALSAYPLEYYGDTMFPVYFDRLRGSNSLTFVNRHFSSSCFYSRDPTLFYPFYNLPDSRDVVRNENRCEVRFGRRAGSQPKTAFTVSIDSTLIPGQPFAIDGF